MENHDALIVKRTDSSDEDFIHLVTLLDKELAETYVEEYDFYHQYNTIENIKNVVVLFINNKAVGCGAIKNFDTSTMEIKRMFTLSNSRGRGVAGKILKELECWAKELNYEKCILETGIKQHAAVSLYKRNDYISIPNYGQYIGASNSICFLKTLT